ncbi:MAG TPA: zinc ribbon domain-containing protein [Candidatus Eremiobacteraeota bacterium]|nr:MAG: Zinc ribbon domain protein [bacterium ADurb.Bin363]HPZ08764.1 zinc ribbon domain-containing protein [Candidatus Eremiobacteraeota bacterium]
MAIYEYSCMDCKKRFSLLEGVGTCKPEKVCPRCKSKNLKKLISLFSVTKSEEARLEALADPSKLSGIDENDPASIARWAKKMGKELGEDMGEDFDQMVEEEMSGEGHSNEETDDRIY